MKIKLNRKTLYFIAVSLLLVQISNFVPFGTAAVTARTDISVHIANNMINNNTAYPDLIVLDVRTIEEYDINHLHDAVLIPVAELGGRLSELSSYNDTEIIVYCASGSRSLQASNILVGNNFSKIFNMLGGITAWIDAGYDYWKNEDLASIDFAFPMFLISIIGMSIVILFSIKSKWNRTKSV